MTVSSLGKEFLNRYFSYFDRSVCLGNLAQFNFGMLTMNMVSFGIFNIFDIKTLNE